MVVYRKIEYDNLNPRQQESYNFQKISAILADYGYITIRLSSDWESADFIAQHCDGTFLKVQLKARLTVAKKYCNKDLYICFPHNGIWYLVLHDELLKEVKNNHDLNTNQLWATKGEVDYGKPSQKMLVNLRKHIVPPVNA